MIAWGIGFLIGVAVGVAIMAWLRFEAYSVLESELERTRCNCKQTGSGTTTARASSQGASHLFEGL